MSRDESLLKSVSDLFTEETLKDIVIKATNRKESKNVEIVSWDFDEANAKGDSYLSITNKVIIKGKIDKELVDVKIFVKSLPQNLGRRKTFRSAEFFHNEINFYREIVPKFEQFVKKKGSPLLLCVPKCLAYVLDGSNDFLVLEDVSPLGFGPISRKTCVDFASCCSMLYTMARFHAISFAYKDQKKDEFSKMKECLKETYYATDLWKWYERFEETLFRVAKDALAKEYPGSTAETKFNALEADELYTKNVEFCSRRNTPTAVVSHGDCWAPNFLIRDLSGSNDKQVLMLDFQLARCSSPILDISFMIYSCTDKTLRDEHYDQLLKIYYHELKETISKLGSDPEELYSWNTFKKEVEEQFVFGFIFALEAVPFSVVPDSEAFDLDIIKGDNAVDIADVWTLSNIKDKEARRRLADVIVHASENGYF